jgi:hypothetical protein
LVERRKFSFWRDIDGAELRIEVTTPPSTPYMVIGTVENAVFGKWGLGPLGGLQIPFKVRPFIYWKCSSFL